ncbi:phospholipase D [Vibrio orientalis CIP 102891 = ATCC 33934]|uniref:Cardiolipin synthetase n=1 Tax=Vibrio orientalis CIP 102891 = ATCC 33934 TaxID=675816 RepID=C9QDQ5_VIBOR|nr:phospholipase D family protein [Vibrio orientalis]EEX93957.1 cardiolipin synthetase [Vibrio orientalis CIP 102891 = ATCC 33934]EGU48409.1 phospholipase D [Vibrio orientalis CIP 102891 = ATCC 33934]
MPNLKRSAVIALAVISLASCGSLPEQVVHSNEPVTFTSSTLSQLSAQSEPSEVAADSSSVVLQESGWDALAQRLALVESAEHTIDIQYYIWNSDISGLYLANRLYAAADRGVKVRVMLDDINLNEREDLLTALNAHPNIEIRVFNPIPTRRGVTKWLNFLGDFSRLNRRMHNKSFTVDGAFSIVGGRNIGDEYFDLSEQINFKDRDVLVSGEVVTEIQSGFVDYWNSRWAYPVELLGGEVDTSLPTSDQITKPSYANYPLLPDNKADSVQLLTRVMEEAHWVDANYIYDDPIPQEVSDTDTPKRTAQYLSKLVDTATDSVIMESAYLVFDDSQLEEWQKLEQTGVNVKALTNSMASNDLVTNHSAYAGRRQDMLEHGIDLYELKPDSELCVESTKDSNKCAPSVAYGLHTKSLVIDDRIASIGSFNFNLRSTYLNTESILVINDQEVATMLNDKMEQTFVEENSWHLELKDGDVYWLSGDSEWDKEPETGKWRRMQSGFLQLLPIEKYL